ncbi:MAG: mechanosensitive ion channel family protein [bacterium]|nr:mechanosensitive ion channel family protein [bacterium]
MIEILTDFFRNNIVNAATTFLVVILVCFISHRVIDLIFHYQRRLSKYQRSEDLRKRSYTIGKMIKTALDVFYWLYAILHVLEIFGVNVATLMTGAGILGALIGFGAQNTIRDVLAGVFIVLENQYRVGDNIEIYVDSRLLSGKVENISLRITQMRDRDGKLHTIRNGATQSVTNMSFRYANINFTVGVAYATDIDKLEKVVNEVGLKMIEEGEPYAKQIIEPIHFARVNGFLDSEIEINCIGRVRAGQQWDITGHFRRMLKKAFDQNGIEFPFPQVVVHDQASVSKAISEKAAAASEALRQAKKKKKN